LSPQVVKDPVPEAISRRFLMAAKRTGTFQQNKVEFLHGWIQQNFDQVDSLVQPQGNFFVLLHEQKEKIKEDGFYGSGCNLKDAKNYILLCTVKH